MQEASELQEEVLLSQTKSLADTAAAYRHRRKRHPPPRFDLWYDFAVARDAIIVEKFWDLIEHDLLPFWALPARRLRRQAYSQNTIRIRGGKIEWHHEFNWVVHTANMIKTFVHLLPDMDINLNLLDEPRVVVPWEIMNNLTQQAYTSRLASLDTESHDMKRDFTGSVVADISGSESADHSENLHHGWRTFNGDSDQSNWPFLVAGCSPDSAARKSFENSKGTRNWNSSDIPTRPVEALDLESQVERPYMNHGYIANYTGSSDICQQPELEFLHGAIVNPLSTSHRNDLIPMFGGSKMSVHNEITIPAPMHYPKDDLFDVQPGEEVLTTEKVWPTMRDQVIWRGTKSGGFVTFRNWKTFHRHRFISMTNPAELQRFDEGTKAPNWVTFDSISSNSSHHSKSLSNAARHHKLADTFAPHLLTAFTEEPCTQEAHDPDTKSCEMRDSLLTGNRLSLAQQFEHKYLPDVDGNSFSGRFRAFVKSDSVPIKATIFREWLDMRLLPWLHFVPMSNTFHDFYPILEYFVGYKDKAQPHDESAKWIAQNGRDWGERVLRREDQEVYMFRVLLEYARVLEDDRDVMGFLDDLVK